MFELLLELTHEVMSVRGNWVGDSNVRYTKSYKPKDAINETPSYSREIMQDSFHFGICPHRVWASTLNKSSQVI